MKMKKNSHSLETLNKQIKDDLDVLKLEKIKYSSLSEKKKSFSSLSTYSNELQANNKRVPVKKIVISARSALPRSVKTSLHNTKQLKRNQNTTKPELFKSVYLFLFF